MYQTDNEKKRILVIDDDPSICQILRSLLSVNGSVIDGVSNGSDGLKLLKSDSPIKYDLLILDLMMPEFNGYLVLRELKQGDYQHVPVMIITGLFLDSSARNSIYNDDNILELWNKPFDVFKFRDNVYQTICAA